MNVPEDASPMELDALHYSLHYTGFAHLKTQQLHFASLLPNFCTEDIHRTKGQ